MATEKERVHREMLVVKAQAALDKAQREHEERTESLEADCAMIERRIETEKTVEQKVMTLESQRSEKEGKVFLHRGISARNFKRQFTLADHVEVKGACFENGLLVIELLREIPKAMMLRRIAINGATPGNVTQIESKAA